MGAAEGFIPIVGSFMIYQSKHQMLKLEVTMGAAKGFIPSLGSLMLHQD